jgi:calmodulin
MKPFINDLRKVILDLNEKLSSIDTDISYFGGIFYDELTWGGNVNISDLGTVWKKLMGPGILLSNEASARILRDCSRYVFFSDMITFLKSLCDAKIANEEVKKKAETEKRIAEKKAANERERELKKKQQPIKIEQENILDTIKAAITEEKIIEETRNIAMGQILWKRMSIRQKIASAVKNDIVIISGTHKTLSSDYLNELKDAFTIFDADGSGSISSDELGDILKILGQNTSSEELRSMISKIDQDGNGTIDFEEFADFLASGEKVSVTSVESAFKVIDINGNGALDKEELRDVLTRLGESPRSNQIEYMMLAAGVPLNAEIDFQKFIRLMNCDFN